MANNTKSIKPFPTEDLKKDLMTPYLKCNLRDGKPYS